LTVALLGVDLLFRSKLSGIVTAAGGVVSRDAEGCDLAVIAIEAPRAMELITTLHTRGVPVLAFGPHGRADLLRAARDAGAVAVPNSQIAEVLEQRLR